MTLICSNVALFHVKHLCGTQEVSDFRSKRCHPKLRRHFPNEFHELRKILAVQFRCRIVEQQRGPPRSFLLLNLDLREHQTRGDQLLLATRNTVLCRLAADLNDDIGAVRAELGRPIASVAFAVVCESVQE